MGKQEVQRYTKEEVIAASVEYFRNSPLFVPGMSDDDYMLPARVFANKYAERDKHGNYYERTPDDMHRLRLMPEFARIEEKYPNPMSRDTILGLLQYFGPVVPQGSPMFGIGNRFQLVSTSNCMVRRGPRDTMSDIFAIGRDMANLYKRRAGVGTDLSNLRPAGAPVNNAAGSSTGAYSFGEFFSNVTRMVGQAGRRGALMLTMDVRHPDIEQFVTMKLDRTKVTAANISVKMSDDFMLAVEADKEYTLRWPVDARLSTEPETYFVEFPEGGGGYMERDPRPVAKVEKVVKAREVFKLIAETACKSAEPGLLFWDNITVNLPLDYYPGFKTISTNPCGEVPLSDADSCRLISVYLPHFVKNKFRADAYFDFEEFYLVVGEAMRLSDDLVDLELEKLEKLATSVSDTEDERAMFAQFVENCRNGRRTGLGTHGLADALAQLRIKYDSEAGIDAADSIYMEFKTAAYAASVELAKERGPFPAWDWETEKNCDFIKRLPGWLRKQMKLYGRRNGALLTMAPTGSTSIESGNCSSGVEPVFGNWYYRNMKVDVTREGAVYDFVDEMGDAWKQFKVFHPNVLRYLQLAYEDPATYDDFTYREGYENPPTTEHGEFPFPVERSFEEFCENVVLPDYFVTAPEIDWQARVQMQATIQQHIDHSISSTLNLPKGTTPETVEAIYREAWKKGCKGVTVYVDGSREAQVLSTEKAGAKAQVEETVSKADFDALFDDNVQFGMQITELTEQLRVAEERLRVVNNAVLSLQQGACTRQTTRGVETEGKKTKAKFHDVEGRERAVYVYVGKNEAGQPVEVFVNDEKGDEELKPYAAALGRLVSLLLKEGVEPGTVSESLKGLRGGSISYGAKTYHSVPDMVATLLLKAAGDKKSQDGGYFYADNFGGTFPGVVSAGNPVEVREDGALDTVSARFADPFILPVTVEPVTTSEGPVRTPKLTVTGVAKVTDAPRGEKCPDCSQHAVFRVDGCPTCKVCGFAKCS